MKGQGSGLTSPGPARTSLGYLGRRTPLVVWVERRLPYFAGWDVQPRLKLARSKNTSSVASLETCRLMQRGGRGYIGSEYSRRCAAQPLLFLRYTARQHARQIRTRDSQRTTRTLYIPFVHLLRPSPHATDHERARRYRCRSWPEGPRLPRLSVSRARLYAPAWTARRAVCKVVGGVVVRRRGG